MTQSKIALVDVGCLFKRTFEANPNKGAENTLAEIIRIEERVSHLVLCLDYPPYKRREIFPDYKAHRPEPETTETYQKRWLYDQLKERGYPMARLKGEEGDDVIATLARIYAESWPEVWLVGADKDLAQCVTDNVLQLVPKQGERAEYFRGPAEVKDKFGVTPEQIPLYLALTGDKSDNVPGVPGIGPVNAARLVGEHKTLTGIAAALANGSGKMWDSLRANWEQLVLSLKLTTLDSRLPLDAEALLVRAEPKVAETMAPKVELEFDGFMGNAIPMPEPIIGKDPGADAFLREQHEKRTKKAPPVFDSEHPDFPKWGSPDWAPKQGPGPLEAARVKERAAAIDAVLAGQVTEAKLADMPTGTVKPRVTEAEFDPISRAPGATGAQPPMPPKAEQPKPAPERADRPGLAKTAPEYGIVTSKLEPEDLRSAEVIAKWLDAGGLYKAKFKTPAAIVTVIMYGKALGLPMMAALSGFHIIEGKPSASADLIRALAMRSPKCKYFRLVSADETQATWETWHRDHDEPSRLVYTIEEARKAGLRGGNWSTREKQMLVKTCSTILARWVYTIETMGLYCPEEMGDYVDTVGEAA